MLEIFKYEEKEIRTIIKNDEPWFIAKDVAEILGYKSPKDAISAHCKGALKCRLPSNGGNQDFTIIPERDVYRLIMKSKLPAAEKFEEWVVGEVLPSIRKTGKYESSSQVVPKDILIAQGLIAANELLIEYKGLIEEQQILIEEQKPKVEAYNIFLEADNAITIKEFANVTNNTLRLGEKNMFRKLRDNRFLAKSNLPFQRFISQGIFKVIEKTYGTTNRGYRVYPQTLVTTKGVDYLLRKLNG